MFIIHMALGGCLKTPPISFGITADTGGHIAYVIDAAIVQRASGVAKRVSIVTRRFRDARLPIEHDLPSETIADGVTIDRVTTAERRYLEKAELAAGLPAFTEAFCAHLAALPALPDVIHAHFADAAAVAIEARRRFGVPFVFTPHALAIDKQAQGLGGDGLAARIVAERTAIGEADALIVSTRDEAERQVRAYGVTTRRPVACLSPGVPRRPLPRGGVTVADRLGKWLDNPERPIILAIARPVAKKNLAGLVRSYAGDPMLRDRANLVILAGQRGGASSAEEDVVRAELSALADVPELRGRVALPPCHDADDVSALYALAARGGVFVNPALHEPFGLTLIEAAEAGVPVVATCNGGPAEIIARIGHGLSVDPRDEAAIAAACRAVIDDPVAHAAFAALARAHCAAYDWAHYAERSIALYAALPRKRSLLACDIDNTLTGCRESAEAFTRWRRASGMPFVVATGRSFDMARTILDQWRLPEPDAFIVDVGTRIMLAGPTGWSECGSFAAALDRGWDRSAVERALAPMGIAPQPEDTAGPHKLSYFGDADDVATIRAALAAAGLSARVVFSHGNLIDVVAPAGGKAAAVAAYAGRVGLTLADCIAAGDSGNDLDMLDACGSAIVVANASEELAALTPRVGLHRVDARHAAGVLEGLERLGHAPRVAA